ncbi:MAG: hypothetical protein LBR55_02890 [Bacteroidales bacterium]|jgi:hypothetical protein|nr:hypothetical protein [Bacteroidales bacterium]
MKKLHRFAILIISMLCFQSSFAQTFEWNAQFEVIADNREYFNPYGFSQTLIGTRLKPEIGFAFDDNQRVMVGASYFLLVGDSAFSQPVIPVAYYNFHYSDFDFYAGFIPRQYQKHQFPLAFYTDSLYYFSPVNQGFVANYSKKWGKFSISQSGMFDFFMNYDYGAREQFVTGIAGNVRYKFLQMNNYYYYHHQASDNAPGERRTISDNGCAGITGGLIYNSTNLFYVSAQAGALFSWNRTRPEPHYRSTGFFADAEARMWILGAQVTHYNGDGIFLPLADPLYRSGDYTRLSAKLSLLPKRTKLGKYNAVNFSFNWHKIDGEWNSSQQLVIQVKIDEIKKKKQPVYEIQEFHPEIPYPDAPNE